MAENTSSYPYASARVRAMEQKLITRDKLNRVIEATSADMALRVLQELGYGQSASGKMSFEDMIAAELDAADAFLIAVSPSDTFVRIMRAEKDFYNLKVLIKMLMLDRSLEEAVLSPGNIPVETMRRALSDNNYYDLPGTMKDALNYIDKQFAVAPDVSVIGIALDRAYAKEIRDLVRKMGNDLVTRYFTRYFDMSNFIALLRMRKAGHSKETFERVFLKGGSIKKSAFADAYETPNESLFDTLMRRDYSALAGAWSEYEKTGQIYLLEKARDDDLLARVKQERHDMFGIAPLMSYFIAKQREAAAVRMVMTAKQGGIDNDVVTERLKELY
jgi:V/A-type H+-transporting ATPase subunit C